MRICGRFGAIPVIIICLFGTAGSPLSSLAQDKESVQQARAAIQRLHEQDVRATLTGKADDLAKLCDSAAVRIQPGGPVEIGKATIYVDDKREEAKPGGGKTLCYKPEMKDLQIAGDWAFEWGYFSYKESANAKPGRGKVLRVIKRQLDGSWKFARVIGFTEPVESAAPMLNPCQ